MKTIEAWFAVDEDGEWGCGDHESSAREDYEERIGGEGSLHIVHATLEVPVPTKPKIIRVESHDFTIVDSE